jgi:hypothetical protein
LRVWPYWFISDVFPTLTTEEERKRRRDQKNSGKISPEKTEDKKRCDRGAHPLSPRMMTLRSILRRDPMDADLARERVEVRARRISGDFALRFLSICYGIGVTAVCPLSRRSQRAF